MDPAPAKLPQPGPATTASTGDAPAAGTGDHGMDGQGQGVDAPGVEQLVERTPSRGDSRL
ncbi:hypothetical protein [Brevibacterium sandarakinum]|uniref:hypothetical protein n=1 Tax=Brevibacterium sandarakinum TaxID=629680 RepID=UPI002655A495|nr:hypothetical protein [Brevibacterium sandarakinum]MDN5657397.1 hypothetical protein [Brevibacterium sandarakinum]